MKPLREALRMTIKRIQASVTHTGNFGPRVQSRHTSKASTARQLGVVKPKSRGSKALAEQILAEESIDDHRPLHSVGISWPAAADPMRTPTRDMIGLMVHVLWGSANLRGAACISRHRLFDVDVRAQDVGYRDETTRWSEVQKVCQSCPARGQCWEWASAQTSGRISGPTAPTRQNPFAPVKRHARPATQPTTNTRRSA